jgi:hypothetical protein
MFGVQLQPGQSICSLEDSQALFNQQSRSAVAVLSGLCPQRTSACKHTSAELLHDVRSHS